MDAADVVIVAASAAASAAVVDSTRPSFVVDNTAHCRRRLGRASVVVSRTINLPLSDEMFVRSPCPTVSAEAAAAGAEYMTFALPWTSAPGGFDSTSSSLSSFYLPNSTTVCIAHLYINTVAKSKVRQEHYQLP